MRSFVSVRPTVRGAIAACVLMLVAGPVPAAAQEAAVGAEASAHEASGHAHEASGHAHVAHASSAPSEGLRAELSADIDVLERKYTALEEATREHYGWRPAEGVRSVSEVYMHVAAANFMIPGIAGVEPPSEYAASDMQAAMARMRELETITDPEEVRERLTHSFQHVRDAIAGLPEEEMEAEVDLFGQPATKRAVLILTVTHMHEHLGQAVAYARTNGVVPPWSAGGE